MTTVLIGNLTADPELRFINSGAAVVSFTVASTPRIYDKATQEWKDGEALFMRCCLQGGGSSAALITVVSGCGTLVRGGAKECWRAIRTV